MLLDFDLTILVIFLALAALVVFDGYWVFKWWKQKKTSSVNIKPPVKLYIRVFQLTWVPILNVLIVTLCATLFWLEISPTPAIDYARSYPATNGNLVDYNRPIEVVFNMPVQINRLRPFVSPEEFEGEWVYERYLGFLPVTRKALFYPKRSLLPGQRIVVYITGVSRYRMEENHEHALNFFSHQAPEIRATTPANESQEVNVNTPIDLSFTSAFSDFAKWEYQITPAIEFDIINKSKTHISIVPLKKLNQGETYTLNVFRTSQAYILDTGEVIDQTDRELVHELKFTTNKAPLVKKFSPLGTGVKENTPIRIIFETAMERSEVEAALAITPNLEFSFNWDDDKRVTLVPLNPLTKETMYSVKIPAGIKTKAGGVLEQDIEYTFVTIGAIKIAENLPANQSVRVPVSTSISVAFDQEVDQSSAQAAFSITPAVSGTFKWSGNSFTFTPSQRLAYSTTYTVKLNAGIKSIYGIDSREAQQFSFTTASNFYLIPGFSAASFYEQRYPMTCAVASAKMALAWKGYNVSEETLYNQIGQAPGQYIYDPGKTNPVTGAPGAYVWADPNQGFAGPIWGGGGTDPNRAFGVYWSPIQRVLQNNYGIQSEVRQGWNIYDLARTVEQGRPVQVWAWNGLSYTWGGQGGARMDWYTQDNRVVYAINGMHSWLIVGFYGESSAPTSFIYLDPWRGFVTKPASEFDSHWSYYNRTGLVVY